MEKGLYANWAELLRIHCRAYLVLDHLSHDEPPPAASPSDKEKDKGPQQQPIDMAT